MRDVRRALRALAELEPGELPVLSIYLDVRPHAIGENAAQRGGIVLLQDHLREIEKTYLPCGPEPDSIRADAARIDRYLEDEYDVAADGLALFACAGRELFETVEADMPFQHQVTVAPQPDVFHLARLLDEQETAVVAVIDSNTSRLFVTRRGGGLGVAGLEATRTALEHGQVDELLLDPAEGPDEATRAELVRLASLTAAAVQVVEGHDGLRGLGGIGALLRYRHN